MGLAYAATFASDVARGNALAEQGLALFRELGDTRGLAEALVGIAVQATHAGAYARAEALGAEALARFRAQGDTGRVADALWVLGVAALFQGQYERAAARHQECLDLWRGRGDERGTVQPLTALAMIALQRGDQARARALLEETLAILERYDDRWTRAMALTMLGQVELASGNPSRAVVLLDESAALFRSIGNLLYLPWCLEGLAGVAAARGEWARAARLGGARDSLCARLGFPLPPAHPAGYAATLAAARAALGDEAFAAAREAGRALSRTGRWSKQPPSHRVRTPDDRRCRSREHVNCRRSRKGCFDRAQRHRAAGARLRVRSLTGFAQRPPSRTRWHRGHHVPLGEAGLARV
jgi:tetratricopeptide (TPR) repeat protein